ncbi:unnamed protein product, partial [Symbiodinium necroappetens]
MEAVSSVEEAVDYMRQAEERLFNLEAKMQRLESTAGPSHLQARLNTLALRLDSLEQELAAAQAQLTGSHGIPLRAEINVLSKILSDTVESVNRLHPELLRLLAWRDRFTFRLQEELMSIGHRFAQACPPLEVSALDAMEWDHLARNRLRRMSVDALTDSFRRERLPEQDRFALVYQEWLQVVLPWAGITVLGMMLSAAVDQAEKIAIVTQTLGGKALSTLEKRLRQVKAFLAWALLFGVTPFPLTEHVCRMYLKKLVQDNAPASRIKGVLELVAFLRHVVGLPVADNAGDSPWIRGVLRAAAAKAKPTSKARPLTVGEVSALEEFVKRRQGALQDVYAAGCFLYLIYSRARFGDCKIISNVFFDLIRKAGDVAGYVEVISWSHKMRRHFPSIPLVARAWLSQLLVNLGHASGTTVGAHSCKATCLSWCSKFGISKEVRTRLGNHNDRGSAECYGRDTLAGPLRDLEGCVLAVRTGAFLPDMSRSGYFPADASSRAGDSSSPAEAADLGGTL